MPRATTGGPVARHFPDGCQYSGRIADHYERLGVSSTATRDEIRVAYRTLARVHHPDAKGDSSATRMAQINEAWHVLSDPGRRAMYDAQNRGSYSQRVQAAGFTAGTGSASGPASGTRTATRPVVPPLRPNDATPARFPWRFMLIIGAIGIAFIIVNAALTKPAEPAPPDNLMVAGSCVDVMSNGDAIEVLCDGANDGVVVSLIPADQFCPQLTESHRDRQGMGQVCVRLATTGG